MGYDLQIRIQAIKAALRKEFRKAQARAQEQHASGHLLNWGGIHQHRLGARWEDPG